MFKRSHIIVGMVTSTIIILVITKLATDSLNPMEIFRGDSLFLKVIVGFLCFGLILGPIQLLFNQSLTEKRCTKCGLPLIDYASSHGDPMICNYCRRWFHSNCFKMNGGTLLQGCQQPDCPSGRNKFEQL